MNSGANTKCPCGGRLDTTETQDEYRCRSCDRILRQVVVEELDRFKRVAESDGPASEIAQAALEGVRE